MSEADTGAPAVGLTAAEASRRLAADGPNEIPHGDRRTALRIFVAQFESPLVGILVAAAAVSYLLHEHVDATVILLIVGLNSTLGFAQEYHADRALRALRGYVTRTARVRRDGVLAEVRTAEVVRGDLVELEIGDLVPADLRIVTADDLAVDESPLTGESLPVALTPGAAGRMGGAVVSGYGAGVVTATGARTVFGRTAALLAHETVETDFQRNLRRFSAFLLWLTVGLTLFVFVANALLGKGWFEAFLFAVALAVGITPEVLPTIVTVTLARGALRMARKQVVVKRLIAIEDLGNVDVLCCDKTGTLTEGRPTLLGFVDASGATDAELPLYGALTGSAGSGVPSVAAPTPIDQAIWTSTALHERQGDLAGCYVVDRNAFDFHRRRASVLVRRQGRIFLIAKGATESVVPVCETVMGGGVSGPLTPEEREKLVATARGYEAEGFRVLAVAVRPIAEPAPAATTAADERELEFRGFLLFGDHPKPEVQSALDQFARLGVAVKIMSGDSPIATQRVCREVGLALGPDDVITGDELARLTDDDFQHAATTRAVFARVTPEQKHRLVTALRAAGHVVGFLGDGVNDAPAIRAADAGIAVDSGTDVAKEAADVVLLEKSLTVVGGGIVEGRTIFANVTKYLLNTMSANLGNMMTVAASSLFLPFIPLLPSQILLNNFLSDIPLITLATDHVDAELLRRPRRWRIGVIARFMVLFGLLSAAFDFVLIVGLLMVWRTSVDLFRTAWFVESACSEIIVTFAIRTQLPWYRSSPSRWLVWTSVVAGISVFLLPYSSIGRSSFAFVPLPVRVVALTVGILVVYFLSAEVMKRPFFRRFGM